MAGQSSNRGLRTAASRIEEITAPVFAELDQLAGAARDLVDLNRHPAFGTAEAWHALEPSVAQLLRSQGLATGAGLAVRPPEAGPDASPSMAWWVRIGDEVKAKQHVFNPRSDSFYDVTQARWFRLPFRNGSAVLLPPYVDSWGTDDVTMTASAPLFVGSAVAGVVAADLDARGYVSQVETLLAEVHATALLDDEDRVIVSTAARLESGMRLAGAPLGPDGIRIELPSFGWSVARLDDDSASGRRDAAHKPASGRDQRP